ncbi:thioredoxin domain-containing protein [Ancylobacter terrae]|uniref:hydrogenase n=1 Tax=Ancylobacter sp. sgz301288 TaxID=3342077 RepID=UPI00385EF384
MTHTLADHSGPAPANPARPDTVHPLVGRLIDALGYAWIDAEPLPDWTAGARLLLLPAHGRPHDETPDLAVVLPELVAALRADGGAVAGPACERALRERLGGIALPAIVVLRGREPVGSLSRMRDWDEFLERLAPLVALAREASAPPVAVSINS